MDIKSLSISLALNLSEFKEKLSQAQDDLKSMGPSLLSTGAAMTSAFTVPMMALGGASLDLYGDFESSMNKVSSLGNIHGSELAKLTDKAKELGAASVFSANDAATAMAALSSAGFSANEQLAATEGLMDLAAAGGLGMAEAATIAGNTLRGFGMEASQMGHVSDVMASAAASANMTIGDMGYTFKNFAPIAKGVGLDIEQVGAMMIALANNGVKGEQAATGMRGAIASLISPSKNQAAVLKELGVEVMGLDGKMRPLNDIFFDLKNAGISAEQQYKLFGREAANVSTILTDNAGPALTQLEEKLRNADGEAKRMADTMLQGYKGAQAEFQNILESIQLEVGKLLASAMIPLMDFGGKLLENVVMPLVEWFQTLPTSVQSAALAFGVALAAIGPLATILGLILTFPVSATVLAWSAGLAALAAACTWVWQESETVRNIFGYLWGQVSDLGTQIGLLVENVSVLAGEFFASNAQLMNFIGFIGDAIGWVVELGAKFLLLPFDAMIAPLKILNAQLITQRDLMKELTDAHNPVKEKTAELQRSQADAAMAQMGLTDAQGNYIKSTEKTVPAISKLNKSVEEGKKKKESLTDQILKLNAAQGAALILAEQEKKLRDDLKIAAAEQAARVKLISDSLTDLGKKTQDQISHDKAKLIVLNQNKKAYDDQQTSIAKNIADFQLTKKGYDDTREAADKLNESLKGKTDTIKKLSDVVMPEYIAKMMQVKTPTDDYYDAIKKLGIQSTESLTKVRDEAKKTYDILMSSDKASEYEKNNAYVKLLEATKAASVATGEQLPKDFDKALKDAKAKVEGNLPAIKTPFEQFSVQCNTIITNMVQDFSKSLWSGDLSFAEKFKSMGKSVAESFTSTMITPMMNSMNKLMTDGLSKLISSFWDLDGVMGKIFGTATSGIANTTASITGTVANTAANAGNAASNAASNAGNAAASAGISGAMGVVGAVSSAISAVSDIISNFQLARQENTLNAIEKSTRYLCVDMVENQPNVRTLLHGVFEMMGYLVDDSREFGQDGIRLTNLAIRNNTSLMQTALGNIESSSYWTLQKCEDLLSSSWKQEAYMSRIATGVETMVASGGNSYNITVNTNSSDGQQIGEDIMMVIKNS